jgi:3-oxoacyl-[acyl-carrier-protein] synthase II
MQKRVVITGVGVVSSIGVGRKLFWDNLVAGKSGISEVATFNTADYLVHKAGEVKNFEPGLFIPNKDIRKMARASQFAVAATKMAINDAGIQMTDSMKTRTGVSFGTTMADIQSLEQIDKYWIKDGESAVWALNILKYPSNSMADHIGYFFGFTGPNRAIPTACSAGNYSIGYAFDLIRNGKADYMIAGGADPFSRITFTGFSRLFAVAPDKCQPFDKNRKGMMVGEGGAALFVESLDSAKARGARVYCEILGYALSCDAHHMTAPLAESISSVMKKAIKNSNISTADVDYVSSHGTGTPINDKTECVAIKDVFKDRVKDISVNSIKSMLGHTMGAASAIEAIACALAIKESIIPPTINYDTPDPECDIDCTPNINRERTVRAALNNSMAFGGNNACVVFGAYKND